MPPNWDSVFDTINGVRAKRSVTFREATSYSLVSQSVSYASDSVLPAKILWRNDGTVPRGRLPLWQEMDKVSLIIWFRDLTGDATSPSDTTLVNLINRFKGKVNDAEGEYYSRFIVDGQELKVRDTFPIERPDGKIYAFRIILQAAE